jgi:hypothetical protein
MTDQRCGTCRHWHHWNSVRFDVCTWLPDDKWPFWMVNPAAVGPDQGTNCPTWEATDE